MAAVLYPSAVWRGNCVNNSGPRTAPTRGVVIHVNDGPNVSLWSWVNSPTSDMSCHFQILQNGLIEQYLDTDLFAWCQKAGNNAWISIEMPTHPDVGMTAAQIASTARLIRWLADHYGFPVQLTNDPNGYGIGWHGMGADPGQADDWGHPLCPGDIRRGQLPELLTAVTGGLTPEDGYEMPGYSTWSDADKEAFWADGTKAIITRALGGYNSGETVGQALVNASRAARSTNTAVNDPAHGMVVALARVEAAVTQLPADFRAELAALPAGQAEQVDVATLADAVADAALARIRTALDSEASTGAHATAGAQA